MFKMKAKGDYHDLYSKRDVLLLADVFERFRKMSMKYCRLDPCHYFSKPGLSWDAILKMTVVKLDLMSDIDMQEFVVEGLGGGISYIAKRYSEANKKHMESYDDTKPKKYITYLDTINLYGWAMNKYFSCGQFKWLSTDGINKFNLNSISENSSDGYILGVDL